MGFSRPRVNCIVETATAAELFEAPRHPSTRMLLDALQSGRDRALIRRVRRPAMPLTIMWSITRPTVRRSSAITGTRARGPR